MLSHGQVVRLIFGLKLRELRQERGLTPAEMARACDVSVSYLNEIEKGKKYPKADKILSLSKVLGVSYDQLVSLTLSRRLEPISELLQSDLLKEFPLEMFGLDPLRIVELIANAPAKMNAFISTLFEIARNYEMRQENFFLAALRSYQEMHDNYFEELEQDARTFVVEHGVAAATSSPDRTQLERVLTAQYGYTLDRDGLVEYAHLGRLRSVFQPKSRRLLLRQGLSGAQEGFVLGREVAFNYLNLKDRPYVNASFPVRSFDEVLNNFKASYFAGALLMDEETLVRDLTALFAAKTWEPADLLALLTRYDVSPEMFMQRITNLLPRHFGLQSLFFLRFDQANASADYRLTKELHLSRLHNPHGNELHEHYCRRWISVRLLAELRQQPLATGAPAYTLGAQRSLYPNGDEYLCLTLARAGTAIEPAVSVTVGLLCDDTLSQKIRFAADPAIIRKEVNETCERCTIPDCEVRAAAPLEVERRQRQQELQDAIAALVNEA
ncbi:helix-turn-helix domain-containing protein [Hymenobacter lapidiphilus]|uniref:Helix-turn-helix domain-containing protein n=1 Tax=Hymenobacter lapidiphilus TaxID=2608003 RepID=A0A7Y7U447_9BACT|nr:helix-turn-helix transcriptional regulator [Hymenobacter lapidiphilus]NVO29892.1 helix-turn-helix domain-containing protein [Hymenobacter lapidiphilus]